MQKAWSGVYDKCQTSKFAASATKTLPGGKRPKAPTEYGAQLIEKQKVRFSYGISERQLSNYVAKASNIKGAGTAEKLFESLESRLDNVMYKCRELSRRATRQWYLMTFYCKRNRVTIPSYELKQECHKNRKALKQRKFLRIWRPAERL